MSEEENFIARWSRLKLESRAAELDIAEQRTTETSSAVEIPSLPSFDPASLPPVESLVADSDIRPFLQAGVPAELTRAALRSAWTADPAIRDFIGIADNQWDFNEQSAIPGFGSLEAADCAQSPLARALVNQVGTEPSTSGTNDPQCSEPVVDVLRDADLAVPPEAVAGESVSQPRPMRTHGGALPK